MYPVTCAPADVLLLQEGIVNAADLQRQEEDDWLLSMQAEADAEAQTSSQV